MNQSIAELAIAEMVRAINIWLEASGQTMRVQPRDITVTHIEDANGRPAFILAFREETSAPAAGNVGQPYSTMRNR